MSEDKAANGKGKLATGKSANGIVPTKKEEESDEEKPSKSKRVYYKQRANLKVI